MLGSRAAALSVLYVDVLLPARPQACGTTAAGRGGRVHACVRYWGVYAQRIQHVHMGASPGRLNSCCLWQASTDNGGRAQPSGVVLAAAGRPGDLAPPPEKRKPGLFSSRQSFSPGEPVGRRPSRTSSVPG